MTRELKISHAVLGTILTIVINTIVVAVAFGRISQKVDQNNDALLRLTVDVRRIDSEGSAVLRAVTPQQRDNTIELIRRVDRIETKLDKLIERGGVGSLPPAIDGHVAVTRHNPWITTSTNAPLTVTHVETNRIGHTLFGIGSQESRHARIASFAGSNACVP